MLRYGRVYGDRRHAPKQVWRIMLLLNAGWQQRWHLLNGWNAWICRSQRFSLNFQDQGDTATHGGGHLMYCVINFFATIGDSNPGWIWRCDWFVVFELKILVRVLLLELNLGMLVFKQPVDPCWKPEDPKFNRHWFSWLISLNVEESNKWTWLMTLSHRGCNYLDEHCDFWPVNMWGMFMYSMWKYWLFAGLLTGSSIGPRWFSFLIYDSMTLNCADHCWGPHKIDRSASVFHLELRRNAMFFIDGSISPADAKQS